MDTTNRWTKVSASFKRYTHRQTHRRNTALCPWTVQDLVIIFIHSYIRVEYICSIYAWVIAWLQKREQKKKDTENESNLWIKIFFFQHTLIQVDCRRRKGFMVSITNFWPCVFYSTSVQPWYTRWSQEFILWLTVVAHLVKDKEPSL